MWVGSTIGTQAIKPVEFDEYAEPDSLGLYKQSTYSGQGAKLGNGNTLSFNMKKQQPDKSYWIEAAASWDADGDVWGKSENGQTERFPGTTTKTVTLNNIAISGGGTSFKRISEHM